MMIEHLKRIGLTELEAKCYLCLVEQSEQTGYEVAKNISSSRSNVYKALSSLNQKGACQVIEGKSTLYVAVPVAELISKFKMEFKQSSKILKKEIKKDKQEPYHFYNTQGLDAIQSIVKRSIAHSSQSIVVDIDSHDLHHFLPLLEAAEDRGVKVTLITLEEVDTTLSEVIIDMPASTPSSASSSFSMLFDDQKVIIGSLDQDMVPSAVETKHPALIHEVKLAIKHDRIMGQLKKDFGKQIEEKYGKNFFDAI